MFLYRRSCQTGINEVYYHLIFGSVPYSVSEEQDQKPNCGFNLDTDLTKRGLDPNGSGSHH
jgi:hypothetical protein